MNTIKSMGSILLGIAIFLAIVGGAVLFFTFGVVALVVISPYIYATTGILILLNVLTLLVAIIPRARSAAGFILFVSSYVYGLATWIYGLVVTLALWGITALIIGIFLGGVGVIPIGILASVFHGRWDIFFTLLVLIILTYGTRVIATVLTTISKDYKENNDVIDLEPEEQKRIWKDLE
jgi:hypothetical protein